MQSLESEALTRRELFSALEMPTQTEKRKKKKKRKKDNINNNAGSS